MATSEFKARQAVRDTQEAALQQLTPEAIFATYQGLYGQQASTINSLIGQLGLAGQMAGRSTIASLNRAGLGNTGLGAALSGALQRGSGYQGVQLRANAQQSLYEQAARLQEARAGVLTAGLGPLAASAANAEKPWWQQALAGGAAAGATYVGGPAAGGATYGAMG